MGKTMKALAVGTLIALTLAGCTSAPEPVPGTEAEKAPVRVELATKGDLFETILTLGEIDASASYSIMSGRGTVESILVFTGDEVREGQTLFRLDNESLQNNYNATESQLRTIRDNLRVQLDDQNALYDRQKTLYEAGAVSKQDLDRAEAALVQIRKQYEDASVRYAAQVENLRDDLSDREVKSPVEGKVASVRIIENQKVQDELAMEIIDDSQMVVNTFVTADQMNRIRPGDKAQVFPDGDRDKAVEGMVVQLNEVPESSTGLYKIRLKLGPSELKLRPGEFAEVETEVDERTAVVVPKKAVRIMGDKSYVFVAKDNVALQREVVTGSVNGDLIEIVSGIASGERVIVRGQTFLKDRTEIVIVE